MFSVWKFFHKDSLVPAYAMLATALTVLFLVVFMSWAQAAEGDTHVTLAGREVSCPIARYKDRLATIYFASASYTNGGEAGAAPDSGNIYLYMPMLKKAPPVVQWFIFYHECGHLQIEGGGTELRADTWGTKFGVEQGWLLSDEDLQHVCDSWEDAPASGDHPSAKTRCAHVGKWKRIYTERKLAAENPSDIGDAEKPMPEEKKASLWTRVLRFFGGA